MKVFKNLEEFQKYRMSEALESKTVGFVATMGNLHEGHKSLLVRSVKENDVTILSIFVNPTQFNEKSDLDNYPQTLEEDLSLARSVGTTAVILPTFEQIYPDEYRYKVTENTFSKLLCGTNRPGHFDGVLSIVLKLLLIVRAKRTYFGEKDFQQYKLVDGMAKAFFVGTVVVPCAIIRDENGLALSSRNGLLKKEEYELALNFPRILKMEIPRDEAVKKLEEAGLKVDYVEELEGRRFGAVRVGNVRLIDNIPWK